MQLHRTLMIADPGVTVGMGRSSRDRGVVKERRTTARCVVNFEVLEM